MKKLKKKVKKLTIKELFKRVDKGIAWLTKQKGKNWFKELDLDFLDLTDSE